MHLFQLEPRGPGKEGQGQEASRAGESEVEKHCVEKEGKGRGASRKAQLLGLSLGCVFIQSRGAQMGSQLNPVFNTIRD